MKFLKLFFGILAVTMMSLRAVSSVPSSFSPVRDNDAIPALSKKQQALAFMKWFVQLSPGEYGVMRGKKLKFFERASFKMTQYRMKQQLKWAGGYSGQSEGTNWGGFALGFFLGLLGVLGAYIFSKDRNFIKWTWIGCGIAVALSLILLLAF